MIFGVSWIKKWPNLDLKGWIANNFELSLKSESKKFFLSDKPAKYEKLLRLVLVQDICPRSTSSKSMAPKTTWILFLELD